MDAGILVIAGQAFPETDGTDGQVLTTDGAGTIAWEDSTTEKIIIIPVFDSGTSVTTGDGKSYVFIPEELNGMNLINAHAANNTVSSAGTPTVQIYNVTQAADMLSTRITIDASEKTSYTASTQPVIDTANDDVATGNELRVDVDVAGTGTAGLQVTLTFDTP